MWGCNLRVSAGTESSHTFIAANTPTCMPKGGAHDMFSRQERLRHCVVGALDTEDHSTMLSKEFRGHALAATHVNDALDGPITIP